MHRDLAFRYFRAMPALIVENLAMIGMAVALYPALFSQPAGPIVVLESGSILVAYAVAAP